MKHKFISRKEERHEIITEFSTELKKLPNNCNFNCKYGFLVAELFLCLQFIRGLRRNPDIKTKIFQENNSLSFNQVVKLAITIELSQTESSLMNLNNED